MGVFCPPGIRSLPIPPPPRLLQAAVGVSQSATAILAFNSPSLPHQQPTHATPRGEDLLCQLPAVTFS